MLFVVAAAAAHAQSYQWRDVVQVVTINPDGSVIVDDTRTLWTNEDFGEAFICIRLTPRQQITLLEGSGGLGPGPATRAFTQSCDGGREVVVRNEERVKERRVRFVYRLDGSVDFYSDVVQWYWNILEREHPTVIGYSLTVNAPGRMAEPYDAYVHRYANAELPTVRLSDDRSTLTVRFDRVPDGDGVEIRYLMDPSLFEPLGTRPGFEELLVDETRVAGIQSLYALQRRTEWGLVPLAILGAMGAGIGTQYRRVGREPRVQVMKYPFEPPNFLHPAAVAMLLDQSYNAGRAGPAFHATIMDLMRKGYGEFRARGRDKVDIIINDHQPTGDLLPIEKNVLGYLKAAANTARRGEAGGLADGLGPGQIKLSHETLKRYSQSHAATFMTRWGKSVRHFVETERGGDLVQPESKAVARRWGGYTLLSALVPLALAFVTVGHVRFIMIAGTVLIVALAITAYTSLRAWRPEIAQEVGEWTGFRRTLTDFTRMKDAPLDFYGLWDVYYVYAAALGVAEQYLRTLQKAAPLAGVDEAAMVRSAAWMGSGGTSTFTSLSNLSKSISSLSSSLSSASASASSGGSSSGGGGGGGGGSSGGR